MQSRGVCGLLNARVWKWGHVRAWILVLVSLPALAGALTEAPPRTLVLWAWERPEDLRFLSSNVEVAYLASTVDVRGSRVLTQRRRQPLLVNDRTVLTGVVRIERPRREPIRLAEREILDAVADAVDRTLSQPRTHRVQIDFDARVSERALYGRLVQGLRERFPHALLSVTSLASWCEGDAWQQAALHPDEIVPMAFAMGSEGPSILHSLHERGHFRSRECRQSLGVSVNENIPPVRDAQRVYAFSSYAWTPANVLRLQRELQ